MSSFKSKLRAIKARVLNVVFWSVVSAAFIGPGTVTTATQAGATFGFSLLWALVFSTFACLLLQEASARITIYSGMNLGQAIAKKFEGKPTSTLVLILVIGAIILGSAAYETGNIIGSSEGLVLMFDSVDRRVFVVAIVLLAFISLNLPSLRSIARFMGFVVVFMGFAFFTTAFLIEPSFEGMLRGSFIPSLPDESLLFSGESGAGLLILALIGTTVVPYDIFLGSGVLDKKQKISEMRFGLSVAIILGGVISMAVLIVGTIITKETLQGVAQTTDISKDVLGDHLYVALSEGLSQHIGTWAVYILGFGMFAAGFSSAITAPLASAITAKSLFEKRNPERWKTQSLYFKLVWGGVLGIGFFFGILNIEPVPAIIFAQALNGLILPFISIFLIFVVNDSHLLGKEGVNGLISNLLMGIVVWVTLVLGLSNVSNAINRAWDLAAREGFFSIEIITILTLLISLWILVRIYLIRMRKARKAAAEERDLQAKKDKETNE